MAGDFFYIFLPIVGDKGYRYALAIWNSSSLRDEWGIRSIHMCKLVIYTFREENGHIG